VAQKRGLDLSPIRQYDKALAVLVLLGLLLSLFLLARFGTESRALEQRHRQAVDDLKPKHAVATPQDMTCYDQALRDLHHPLKVELSTNDVGIFIPERRVWCVDCHYPIPYAAEICPFCKAHQPVENEAPDVSKKSSGNDGIPDYWRIKHFGHPLGSADDHSLASDDADGDGFSNLDECRLGTNPRDPFDHPDYTTVMKVASVKGKAFPFVFTSATTMPGGKSKCAFNMKGEDRTLWAEDGQPIGKTGLTLVKCTRRTERRPNPALGGLMTDVDVSEVLLQRSEDQKTFVLRRADQQAPMEQEVVLELTLMGKTSECRTSAEGTLDVGGEKYKVIVIDVDGQPPSVVLENVHTGKKSTVPQ